MASCYLFHVDDSLKGIYKTLTDQAMCSKVAGGLGMSVSDIRSKNSLIGNTILKKNAGLKKKEQ